MFVACCLDRFAPGSYLVLSHLSSEFALERVAAMAELSARRGITSAPRTPLGYRGAVNGRTDRARPGRVSYRRPDGGLDSNADRVWGPWLRGTRLILRPACRDGAAG